MAPSRRFEPALEIKLSLGYSPGSTFVVLPPGESYRREAEPSVLVKRGATEFPGLTPGKYLVQLEVETWPETQEIGKILADRWRKSGNLWTRPYVTSSPLPIEIAEKPKVKSCE
jgi:hypothetical protein